MYKQFYSKLLLLVAMIVAGAGAAWAAEETITFSELGYENQQAVGLVEGTNFTLEFDKGTNTNLPKYYTNGSAVRCYGGNWFKVTSKYEITKVVLSFASGEGTNEITTDVESYENGTWTGSANAVTFTIGGTTGHRRIAAITVTTSNPDEAVSAPTFTPEEGNYIGAQNVTLTCATEGASIYYTLDGSTPTNASTLYSRPINVSETTTIKAIAYDATGAASNVATATYNILSVDHAGTEADPYSVSDAIKYISTLGSSSSPTQVYVKGIVSQVDSYNETYKSITYWISDDGETTTQMEVYSGKGLNNADFASVDDIQVGDEVTVCGTVKLYKQIPEFDYNNYLVSLVRPQASQDPVITAEDVNLAYDATSGEIEFSIENPDESYNVTASADVDWISNVAVAADANKVTFTTTANEGTEAREGNITINYGGTTVVTRKVVKVTQGIFVADYATLTFEFDGGKADIESTNGLTQNGLGDDYKSSPKLKFDGTGDNLILKFNEQPGKLSFDIKGNGFSGGTFTVQTSEDGTTYSDLKAYTELEATATTMTFESLASNVRYIKWVYSEKSSGNVALGNIKLEKYVPVVEYYLAGSFATTEAWTDDMVKLDNNEGIYTTTKAFEAGTTFKIVKKDVDGSMTWYGGEGNPQEISDNSEIVLSSPGNNFVINTEGEYTFTVNTTGTAPTLTVTGWPAPKYFLAGNWDNGWIAEGMIEFDYNADADNYTAELVVGETGVEFKVVDENNKWYRSEPAAIADNGTVTLTESNDMTNMSIAIAGTYTLTLEKTDNGLFLSIDGFGEPVVKYFLAGSWENGWTADGMVELNKQEDGSFINTINNFEANTEFKIVKDVNGAKTWFGGLPLVEGSEYYLVNKDWCTDIVLKNDTEVDGGYKNFKIEKAGDYTFKVTDEGEDGLFLDVAGWVVNYALVTDASQLEKGKDIIIVGENNGTLYALAEQKTNNRGAALVTKEKGIITVNHSGSIPFITLDCIEGEAGTLWGFDTDDGYLYAASSSSNHLKTLRPTQSFTSDANAQATIEIAEDGQATIVFQGTNSHNDLRFNNDNSNNLLFSCYTSDKTYPHAYIYMETELDEIIPTVTIGAAEWATYVAVDNVEFPEEVTAYVPVQVNEGQTAVMIESVNAVKKGEPVILNGEADTYELSYAEEEPAEVVDNIFEVSDGTDVSDGTYYMLSYKNEKVGFRKVQEGVTIPAGKPYIVIVNAAKEFIPFGGGEATGIESFETVGFDVNAPIYDMQGRQVQKLQKGIFIQNGKKLIVK